MLALRNYDTNCICSLDTGKSDRGPTPGAILAFSTSQRLTRSGIRITFGIPGTTRVHIGVVEATGGDANQHLIRARSRNRPVVVIFKLL